MNPFQSIYEEIGEENIKRLTKNFYSQVVEIPELRKLYPEDLAAAEDRLFLFLIQVFGGPQTYSEQRGHPRLRMRHMQWKIDGKLRNHWLNAMLNSMDQLKLEQETREKMMRYFINAANHMVNHA